MICCDGTRKFDALATAALHAVWNHEAAKNKYEKWSLEVMDFTSAYDGKIDFAPTSQYRSGQGLRPNLGMKEQSWYYNDLRGNKIWLKDITLAEPPSEKKVVVVVPHVKRGARAAPETRTTTTTLRQPPPQKAVVNLEAARCPGPRRTMSMLKYEARCLLHHLSGVVWTPSAPLVTE